MGKKLVLVETDVEKLHQPSHEVNLGDVNLVNSIDAALRNTYKKMDGKMQGLAAIQVGYAYKAMLLRFVRGEEPIVVYNPGLIFSFGKKKSNEGCMSEGDDRYIVTRPRLIKVFYYTKYKEKKVEWMTYKKARIFMHEYDHLFGILLQDHGILVE